MLDLKYVIAHTEAVKQNCRNRNVPADVLDDIDRAVALEGERKVLLSAVEEIRRRQNEVAQATGKEKDPAKRAALIDEGKHLKAAGRRSGRAAPGDGRRDQAAAPASSQPDPSRRPDRAHRGRQPRASQGGHPPHLRLSRQGPRRARQVARPDRFRDRRQGDRDRLLLPQERRGAARSGPPAVRDPEARRGRLHARHHAGPGPQLRSWRASASRPGEPRRRSTRSRTPTSAWWAPPRSPWAGCTPTSCSTRAELPIKYVGLSHCFRTEAGAAGRASRGLYRVHQFTKVEMFAFSTPEASGAIHAEMLAIEEQIFQALGIPYRVLDICTGDLGGPAYRKFDLEAWMPGRGEHGEYGEVTSTSDCTDYQSRRLNIRYRPAGQKGTRFVHTLNGTAVALSPGPDRDPGELPAGRRPDRRSRGAAAVRRQGRDRSFLNVAAAGSQVSANKGSPSPVMREGVLPPTVITAPWDEAVARQPVTGCRISSSTDHDGSETEAGSCEIRSWCPTSAS